MAKKISQKSKRRIFWIYAISLCLIAAVITVSCIRTSQYNNKDHAQDMSRDDRYFMNLSITTFGDTKALIGEQEVLVLDTVTKHRGGDTLITFVIYQYPEISDYYRALSMTPEEIAADPAFTYMGTGEVTLRNDEIAQMGNMRTSYIM